MTDELNDTPGEEAALLASDVQTTTAEFGELGEGRDAVDPAALSALYDLRLPVAIELGRTRLAGEPIDVFVGDRRFAEGEVVVVGEQFAVRITRILGSVPSSEVED